MAKNPLRALLAALLLSLCGAPATQAQQEITAVIVLTNVPAGLTSNLVVNAGTSTTRYWTNSTTGTPATSIQTTNTIAWSRTNLLAHLLAYPIYTLSAGSPQLTVGYSDTNSAAIYLVAPTGTNLTVSINGLWARVSYFTNTFAAATPILNRTNSMSHAARTNAANSIANLFALPVTNALGETVNALSNFVSRGATQTLGNKTLTNSLITGTIITNASVIAGTNALIRTFVFINGSIVELTNLSGNIGSGSLTNGTFWSNVVNYARFTNGNFQGTVHTLSGGTWSGATLTSPTTTGLVNSGNPIISDSTGPNAEAYGQGSEASGSSALAVGFSVLASGASSLGVGNAAKATNDYATAVGRSAIAGGDSSTAIGAFTKATNMYQVALGTAAGSDGTMPAPYSVLIGYDTSANWPGDLILGNGANSTTTGGGNGIAAGYLATISATNANAIGAGSAATHQSSTAIGAYSATTKSNEVMLGTSSHHVAVPGIFQAAGISNLVTVSATNILRGDLSFPRFDVSTVAAGHNVIDCGTNIYVRLTGSPGSDWTLGGITSGSIRDGKLLVVENRTGYSVTIQNESGTAPTAAERILTLASSGSVTNATLVGDGTMMFIYSGASARWILLKPDVDVSSTATNALTTISTNGVPVSSVATGLDFTNATGYVVGGTVFINPGVSSGGSQTPYTSIHDAGTYAVTNLGALVIGSAVQGTEPIRIGTNVSRSVDAQVVVARTVVSQPGVAATNSHTFSDSTVHTRTNAGYAANSVDIRVRWTNSFFADHFVGLQFMPDFADGTITNLYGDYIVPNIRSGTVRTNYGVFIGLANGGTVAANNGIRVITPTGNAPAIDYGIVVEPRHASAGSYGSFYAQDDNGRFMLGVNRDVIFSRDRAYTAQLWVDAAAGAGQDTELHGTDATGTDLAGGALTLSAGRNTGAGAPGALIFSTSPYGSTGTASNNVVERMRIATNAIIIPATAGLRMLGNNIASNRVWTATNAVTGEGEWRDVSGGGGGGGGGGAGSLPFDLNHFSTNVTVSPSNAVTLIASNSTTAQLDFSTTPDYVSTDVMRANLSLQLTNLVQGRTVTVFLTGDTNANQRTVTVSTNGMTGANVVRWNFNSPTNGTSDFTVTNGMRAELSLKCVGRNSLGTNEVWAIWGPVR